MATRKSTRDCHRNGMLRKRSQPLIDQREDGGLSKGVRREK